MCREEAAGLASLIPRLRAEGIHPRLVGIVHEDQYLKGFPQYFSGGEIFLDKDRQVYEAMGGLFMGFSGFLSPAVWKNIQRARENQFENTRDGEGRYLGGVLVVGPGDSGVLYEHKEKMWGDIAPIEDVYQACLKLKNQNKSEL